MPDHILDAPSERVVTKSHAGLADAVGKIDEPVPYMEIELGNVYFPVTPFPELYPRPGYLDRFDAAQQHIIGVSVLYYPGMPRAVDVDYCESGVADLPDTAHRQGLHNHFRSLGYIGIVGSVFYGHGGGEVRKDTGLYTAAQPVGKAGDHPVFFFDLVGQH